MECTSKKSLFVVLAFVLMLVWSGQAWAVDSDGDGVDDAFDDCPADGNTPVDSVGCPMLLTYTHHWGQVASESYSIGIDYAGDYLIGRYGDPMRVYKSDGDTLETEEMVRYRMTAPKDSCAGNIYPQIAVDSEDNIIVASTDLYGTYWLTTISDACQVITQFDMTNNEPNASPSSIGVDLDDNVWWTGLEFELNTATPDPNDRYWHHYLVLIDKDDGSVIMQVDEDDLAGAGLAWGWSHEGGVVVDENGLVYVSDYARIIRFDPCDIANTAVVIAGDPNNSYGSDPGEFGSLGIGGIAVVQERLFAADITNDRIQIFKAATGEFIQELGDPNSRLIDIDGCPIVPICGDVLHPYPPIDFDLDCWTNENELLKMSVQWLQCTHPLVAGCTQLQLSPEELEPNILYMKHWPESSPPDIDGNLTEATWIGSDPCWMDLTRPYYQDACDVVWAKYALYWGGDTDDPCMLIFAAVKVLDTDHVLTTATNWNTTDRIEIYVQGDPNGGDKWGSNAIQPSFDKAQQYSVGNKGIGFGLSWGVFGNGTTIPGVGTPTPARFKYKVQVSGSELHYEIQAKTWVWYGGNAPLGPSLPRKLEPGMRVAVDIIAGSRYGSLPSNDPNYHADFGMLSANMATQKFIYAENFQLYELKNYDGTNVPPECGDWGYLVSDISRDADCEVALADFDVLASEYWSCTDPCAPCGYDPFAP